MSIGLWSVNRRGQQLPDEGYTHERAPGRDGVSGPAKDGSPKSLGLEHAQAEANDGQAGEGATAVRHGGASSCKQAEPAKPQTPPLIVGFRSLETPMSPFVIEHLSELRHSSERSLAV